jgi:hypothetical protein
MVRVLMTLFGLALLALGGWLTFYIWPTQVVIVLTGCLALGVLLAGLVVTVLGFSELAGARYGGKQRNADVEASSPSGESPR